MMMQHREQRTGLEGRRLFDDAAHRGKGLEQSTLFKSSSKKYLKGVLNSGKKINFATD